MRAQEIDLKRKKLVCFDALRKEYPLYRAIEENNVTLLQQLVQEEASLNFINITTGYTLLEYAVEVNALEATKVLLKAGADVNFGIQKPLWIAIDCGYTEIALLLISQNLMIDKVIHDHLTYLIHASRKGNLEVVKALVDKGSNVNYVEDNWTALSHAAFEAKEDVFDFLEPFTHPKYIKQAHALLEIGIELRNIKNCEVEDFIKAAFINDQQALTKLLDKKVDPNAFDSSGNTALTVACNNGHEEIVKLLLENGADPNLKDKLYGWNPLFWAIAGKNDPAVTLLIKAGADIEQINPDGYSVLTFAVERSTTTILSLLLGAGIKPDLPDVLKRHPLMLAAKEGRKDMFVLLAPLCRDKNSIKEARKALQERLEEMFFFLGELNKYGL